MLRWLTLLLGCALPVMVAGQEVVCTPFDNNGDNIVGIGDLIDLLARFGDSDLDQDGIWDSEDDCVGQYDLCGICNGPGIDADADGICDLEDDCIGLIDLCGVCNGPGPQVLAIDTIIITYDSIYVDAIDEWLTYELSRDTLLHLVCENPGCTDPVADNFDPYAEEGGLCTYGGPCLGPTFDGDTYEAVLIGDQCWFAENLRTGVYSNGDSIPSGLTDGEWITTTTGATAVYGEGSSSCVTAWPGIDFCDETQSLSAHGRLYNWYAVDDARGLCPSGWHVPTDGEWMVLEMELGMSESEANSTGWRGTDEGTKLKSTSGWTNDGNGTDDFGFSALPGGGRYSSGGGFYSAGDFGFWWSSSPIGIDAWRRSMRGINPGIERNGQSSRRGFSVRCLRDSE